LVGGIYKLLRVFLRREEEYFGLVDIKMFWNVYRAAEAPPCDVEPVPATGQAGDVIEEIVGV